MSVCVFDLKSGLVMADTSSSNGAYITGHSKKIRQWEAGGKIYTTMSTGTSVAVEMFNELLYRLTVDKVWDDLLFCEYKESERGEDGFGSNVVLITYDPVKLSVRVEHYQDSSRPFTLSLGHMENYVIGEPAMATAVRVGMGVLNTILEPERAFYQTLYQLNKTCGYIGPNYKDDIAYDVTNVFSVKQEYRYVCNTTGFIQAAEARETPLHTVPGATVEYPNGGGCKRCDGVHG